MATVKRFEDLEVWSKAVALAVAAYEVSNKGKLKTDFGMRDQLRRAAVSVSNNIAEGFEYNNNKVFIRFLNYSKGSAGEVRNLLLILKKIGLIEDKDYEKMNEQCMELSRQIAGFIKYLTSKEKAGNN